MDKEIVVYIYSELLFYKKECCFAIRDNMDGPWTGIVLSETSRQRKIIHTPNYMWNLKPQFKIKAKKLRINKKVIKNVY